MASLCLCERLGDWVEMVEEELPLLPDERASLLPTNRNRNEVGWSRQLDVEIQSFLESRDLTQEVITVWNNLDVDVDGARSPAM